MNYFQAIRRDLRIPSADIEVVHSQLGTDPMSIVAAAEQRLRQSRAFDKVFAIFDRDDHRSYHDALARAAALDGRIRNDYGKPVSFRAIPSVPSFEFWLLLHFRDVQAFMHRATVYDELRKPSCYPGYEKNSRTVYADTKERVDVATQRAKRLRDSHSARAGTEPHTEADIPTTLMTDIGKRLAPK